MARGWGGDPPRDDNEARSRIIAATKRCLDRYGAHKTGLADVASELGVTRQTVYRHFPTTDDLLLAAALDSSAELLDRLTVHLRGIEEPRYILAEAMVWVIEMIPDDPYVGILLQPQRRHRSTVTMLEPMALTLAGTLLQQLDIAWTELGFAQSDLDDLAELMLRLFTSYITSPDRERTREQRKELFARWLGAWIAVADRGLDRTAERP